MDEFTETQQIHGLYLVYTYGNHTHLQRFSGFGLHRLWYLVSLTIWELRSAMII